MCMNLGYLLFMTEGRISRKTWWFSQIVLLVFAGATTYLYKEFGWHDAMYAAAMTVIMFWFRLNINVKRLHDHGFSGISLFFRWLLSELPVVGWIYAVVVFGFLKGDDGGNEHGATP